MVEKLGKKERASGLSQWDSIPGPRWTGRKATMFWESLLKLNGIPMRDFIEELKRDNDSAKALERLFAKMNKRDAMRQKKRGTSGKGRWIR